MPEAQRTQQSWRKLLKKPPTLELDSNDTISIEQGSHSGNVINTPAFKDHLNSSQFANSSRGFSRNQIEDSTDRISLPESKSTFNQRLINRDRTSSFGLSGFQKTVQGLHSHPENQVTDEPLHVDDINSSRHSK